MKAIVIRGAGGPEVLELQEREAPTPSKEELLVKVMAFGVNRADIIQRKGLYPAPAGTVADVPGLEYAGIVEEVGEGVTAYKKGDSVCGLLAGGGYQEFVTVHQGLAIPVSSGLDMHTAAAIPEAYITAYDALVLQGRLKACETVLVSAAASGVGIAACQLAIESGATVLGSSRQHDKLARLAAHLHNKIKTYHSDGYQSRIKADGKAVDLFIELVGGDYVSANIECAASRARMILVGLLAGRKCQLDLGAVLARRLSITGTTLRARSLAEKLQVTASFARHVMPMFDDGRLVPVLDKVYEAKDIALAHQYMEEDRTFGKVIMTW